MNKILDPGHKFELTTIDNDPKQPIVSILQFVKRCDPKLPLRFPGNHNEYPGTTLQSVIRALHSRVSYLNGQHHCEENLEIMLLLRKANWLLEKRAAKRHDLAFDMTADEAIDAPMCERCGHVTCGCSDLVNEK